MRVIGIDAMVRSGKLPLGSRGLHSHLGGIPALSAYSFIFRNG